MATPLMKGTSNKKLFCVSSFPLPQILDLGKAFVSDRVADPVPGIVVGSDPDPHFVKV